MVNKDGKTDVQIFVRVWIVVVYGSLSRNWEIVQTISKYGQDCRENNNRGEGECWRHDGYNG